MRRSSNSLLKKFYDIIDAEKKRAQDLNNGETDVETVAARVRKLCAKFMPDLLLLLGEMTFNVIIGKRMKRGMPGGAKRRTTTGTGFGPDETAWNPDQMLFDGMEQFRGYPEQLTYVDEKTGRVKFCDSNKSRQKHRHKGEQFLVRIHEFGARRIDRVQVGNRFADELVAEYGDLDLEILVAYWKRDHQDETGEGSPL